MRSVHLGRNVIAGAVFSAAVACGGDDESVGTGGVTATSSTSAAVGAGGAGGEETAP